MQLEAGSVAGGVLLEFVNEARQIVAGEGSVEVRKEGDALGLVDSGQRHARQQVLCDQGVRACSELGDCVGALGDAQRALGDGMIRH